MAITLADFNKIWASTSPLTPYSFSENNYKQGWNFIGSTPPARQMWDFLQKNNDEKMQYLANNYLPLSGGTMSGAITQSNNIAIKRNITTDIVAFCGGTEISNGANLVLCGNDMSSVASKGSFILRTHGTSDHELMGKPDGSLTWSGNSIITSALTGNIVSKGGLTQTMGSNAELCRIETHSAGMWLIVGYMNLTFSQNIQYNSEIVTGSHGSQVTRALGVNGGGVCNVFITQLNENEVVSLSTYVPAPEGSGSAAGNIKMIRLA